MINSKNYLSDMLLVQKMNMSRSGYVTDATFFSNVYAKKGRNLTKKLQTID